MRVGIGLDVFADTTVTGILGFILPKIALDSLAQSGNPMNGDIAMDLPKISASLNAIQSMIGTVDTTYKLPTLTAPAQERFQATISTILQKITSVSNVLSEDHRVFFNFMTGTLDPRITFTRASTAWYMGSNGFLQQAAINVPRFDYDYGFPVDTTTTTPTLKGILMEGTVTNEVLHSCDLTQSAWIKTTATVAKDTIGPDGVFNSASSFTANAANAKVNQSITSAAVVTRYFSVYIKRISGNGIIELSLNNSTFTEVTVPAPGLTTPYTRVSIAASLSNPNIAIRLGTSGDKIAVAFAQEQQTVGPTSPIRTTTTQIIKDSDNAIVSGSNFTDWFIDGPGTVQVEYESPAAANGVTKFLCQIGDGSTANGVRLVSEVSSLTPRLQYIVSNNLQCTIDGPQHGVRTHEKYAFRYSTDNFVGAINGALTATDISGSLIGDGILNSLYLGSNGVGAQSLSGWVKSFKFWNRILTDTELETITT